MNGLDELLMRIMQRRDDLMYPPQMIGYGGQEFAQELPGLGEPRFSSHDNPDGIGGLLELFGQMRGKYRLPRYWGGQG